MKVSKLQLTILYSLILILLLILVFTVVTYPKVSKQNIENQYDIARVIETYKILNIYEWDLEKYLQNKLKNLEKDYKKTLGDSAKLNRLKNAHELVRHTTQTITKLASIAAEIRMLGGQGDNEYLVVNIPQAKPNFYKIKARLIWDKEELSIKKVKKIVNDEVKWLKQKTKEWKIALQSHKFKDISLPILDPKDNPIYKKMIVPMPKSMNYEEVTFNDCTVIEALLELKSLQLRLLLYEKVMIDKIVIDDK